MALTRKAIELLREDPDDLERYRVVADELQAEGDVRGELIALDLARQNVPDDSRKFVALVRERDRLLESHAKHLLGKLWTARSSCRFVWRYGFIQEATLWTSATMQLSTQGRRISRPRVNKLLKHTDELLRLESAVLLEHLTLAATFNAQLFLWDACERVARGAPPTLHTLDLRDLYEGALPDWEPDRQLELVWRGRVLTLRSDSLALESAAEMFS